MTLVNKIKLPLILLAMISFLSVAIMFPATTNAQTAKDAVCESLGETIDGDSGDCSGGGENVDSVMKTVLNILSFVAGIIAVIMMIIAGIKFITSQGDAQAVASARNTVIYAIIGVVIVVISQAVIIFVISEANTATSSIDLFLRKT